MRSLFTMMVMFMIHPFLVSCAARFQHPDSIQTTNHQLSGKTITIKKSIYGDKGLNFLILHDNENTGVMAAMEFCQLNSGIITELEYGNERFISFYKKSVRYAFNPNAIFSIAGSRASLKKYSRGKVSGHEVNLALNLGKAVLSFYQKYNPDYIITLHNNSDLNFDISAYLEGHDLYGTADSVFINPEMDPDDFVLVTHPAYFSYLKANYINSVYQSPNGPLDGSLSVYAQVSNIPYVNIEVQHGHSAEHLRLINVVAKMFSDLAPQSLSPAEKQNTD